MEEIHRSLSERIKELNDKASQLLLFLTFAIAALSYWKPILN